MTRAAVLQLSSSDHQSQNLVATFALVADAAGRGAEFILTPEVAKNVSSSRAHQQAILQEDARDITLAGLRGAAAQHGVWMLIETLALKTDHADGRFANRSLETEAYILAPAQTGFQALTATGADSHPCSTYGHSLLADPWGGVVSDAADVPGLYCVDLLMDAVRDARHNVPSLLHGRPFGGL